ncbi:putative quinol monooxygenase [Chitinophaga filiformis]|uniref:Antibiotic biosynthesis monooxygenase n=1 Tax=Chitinophaga filiformis TaxID=104663 RepID=A0ABY4I4Y2_CHIFI|nr:antibiotic biosynthesis monooxygenase family protein [Chitinophaga filiformis]UPK70922.1 antibiotic biosynthesis monooxygenase [Chitinophaga filiformis]
MATSPVYVFARWKVKEGKMQELLQLLTSLRMQTQAEEGNLFYTVCQDNSDANTLLLSEGYTSATAQQAHVSSDRYKKLAAGGIIPLLNEREVFLTTPIIK